MLGNCDKMVVIPPTNNEWTQQIVDDQKVTMVSSGSGRTPMEKPAGQDQLLQHQQQSLKCPRCDSSNTKFCYYNNYSLSQPRHFCKSCKRYWTRGGTLRNVPVGGGCRKNKRLKRPPPSSSSSASASDHTPPLLPSSSSSAPTTANSDLPSQPHIVDNPINNPLFYGLPTTNSNSDMTLPFPRFNSGYDHHLQHPHLNALGLGFSSGFASNDTLVSSYNSIFGNSSSSNSMASLLINPTTLHQQKLINGGLKEDGLGTNNNNTNFQGLAPLEGVKAEERQNLQIMEHGGLLSDYSPYYWNAATAMGAWSDQSNNVGLI